jgi:hypothetical protein
MSERDDFETWILEGIDKGWCSDAVCDTHEGLPWTDEEMAEHEEGYDFCIPAVRVYGLEKVL